MADITTMLEVPGPIGGHYATNDYARFSDNSTFTDIEGPILANYGGSAFWGIDGILERRPSLVKSASRLLNG